jgi:hypothetical protein
MGSFRLLHRGRCARSIKREDLGPSDVRLSGPGLTYIWLSGKTSCNSRSRPVPRPRCLLDSREFV